MRIRDLLLRKRRPKAAPACDRHRFNDRWLFCLKCGRYQSTMTPDEILAAERVP